MSLNGFLFYRYQQSLPSTGNDAANAPAEEIAKDTTTPPEEQYGVQVAVGVMNTPVGLSIQEDGELVHDHVTNPGFYEEF